MRKVVQVPEVKKLPEVELHLPEVAKMPEVSVLLPGLNKMHEGARPPEEVPESYLETPVLAMLLPEVVVFKPELNKMHEGARPPEEVLQPMVAEQFFIGDLPGVAKVPKIGKRRKKALRAVAARAAHEPPHIWPSGQCVLVRGSMMLLLLGVFWFWSWFVDGDYLSDRVEEVFAHEGGELSCRCVWEGGTTGSQVFVNDGGDIKDGVFEALVDGCHAHCVGREVQVMEKAIEALGVDEYYEDK